MIPGEIIYADGDVVLNEGRDTVTLTVANRGDRPVQVGSHYHFSKPTRRSISTGPRPAACGSTSQPEPRSVSSRVSSVRSHWCRLPASAPSSVSASRSWGRCNAVDAFAGGLRPYVRPDDRRSGPPCRHRALHRGGEGPDHLWRGDQIRWRQGDPRRHGPVAGHPRERRRRYRHHQCADGRLHRHLQGRHRAQGRQHRRHRQGRQPGYAARRRHRRRPRNRGDRR